MTIFIDLTRKSYYFTYLKKKKERKKIDWIQSSLLHLIPAAPQSQKEIPLI